MKYLNQIKLQTFGLVLLVPVVIGFNACLEEDVDTQGFSVPSFITFDGGIIDSDYNPNEITRNRLKFSSLDDITVEVGADVINTLRVNSVNGNGIRTLLGDLSIQSGTGTLNTTWNEVGTDLERFDFTGDPDGEQPFTKRLFIHRVSPVEEASIPMEAKNDSTFALTYDLRTAQTNMTGVEFFQSLDNENFTSLGTENISATIGSGNFDFTMPNEATISLLDTLFVRMIVSAENGLQLTQNFEIINVPVPLSIEAAFTLDTEANTTFAFGTEEDLQLQVNGDQFGLAAISPGTALVVTPALTFEEADFQSLRDEFAAKAPVTLVPDLANLPDETLIIVQLGGFEGASEFAVLALSEFTRQAADSGSVTFDYKSRTE